MNKKMVASILLLAGIILGIMAKLNLTSSFDTAIYQALISLKSDNLTNIFKFITFLGSTTFVLPANILIFIIYLYIRKKQLLKITINSICSVIFNNTFKFLFKRPRPDVLRLVYESNYSYPSGHAMISILFYGTIIILINSINFKFKTVINSFLVLLILSIGISRIYLGVHYASDIIGGILFGLGILTLNKGE